jgi:hypothetical protein
MKFLYHSLPVNLTLCYITSWEDPIITVPNSIAHHYACVSKPHALSARLLL